MNGLAEWANNDRLATYDQQIHSHWSRKFEYPWVYEHLKIEDDFWVLDAGGGGESMLAKLLHNRKSKCRVVNVDLELPPVTGIQLPLKYDLKDLDIFGNETFDRVVCISVLEHTAEYPAILNEMWRVLKVGGRMLVTMDVAPRVRYNHNIDEGVAHGILGEFGLEMPKPESIMYAKLEEENPTEAEPKEFLIAVLCFWVEKR